MGICTIPRSIHTTKGLETVRFGGPCRIRPDDLMALVGKVPNSFLRGIGVPQDLLDYLPSIATA